MTSKRGLRRRACEKKIRHETKEAAEAERFRLQRRQPGILNVYKCQFCGGWHIGHPPKNVQRSIRDKQSNSRKWNG